jgi:hypothetical protein
MSKYTKTQSVFTGVKEFFKTKERLDNLDNLDNVDNLETRE